MEDELVKMSSKGQLVVPYKIRKNEGFKDSDRFVAVEVKGGVLFKRVSIPDVKIEFDDLHRELSEHFKSRRVKQGVVSRAVKWARER